MTAQTPSSTTVTAQTPSSTTAEPYPPALREGLALVVSAVHERSGRVRSIVFRGASGHQLPGYVPGSHLAVDHGAGVNAYSLTGSGIFPEEYAISVLRDDQGSGGSIRMHHLEPGDTVRTSCPRSDFPPIAAAHSHLLVAAGIGITPLLSHARAAAEWGRPATLLYIHREDSPVHVEDLKALAQVSPHLTVRLFTERSRFGAELGRRLGDSALGTHLYACGPSGFMSSVVDAARALGWPEAKLHTETFAAAALDPGTPFTARLAGGGTVRVPSGVSLLEALEGAGIPVPNLCRQGVCGECAVSVIGGRPLHRDHFLSEEERAENDTIMCCVSRSVDEELELRL